MGISWRCSHFANGALPRPACGERVGVRGTPGRAGLAESPPHPEPPLRAVSDLSPQAGRGKKRRQRLNREAAAYWVARSSRAMTAECIMTAEGKACASSSPSLPWRDDLD